MNWPSMFPERTQISTIFSQYSHSNWPIWFWQNRFFGRNVPWQKTHQMVCELFYGSAQPTSWIWFWPNQICPRRPNILILVLTNQNPKISILVVDQTNQNSNVGLSQAKIGFAKTKFKMLVLPEPNLPKGVHKPFGRILVMWENPFSKKYTIVEDCLDGSRVASFDWNSDQKSNGGGSLANDFLQIIIQILIKNPVWKITCG